MQRDLKRLLAYSTVENVGIIFIGLGLALAFKANGMGGAAALAFTAALFHVLNHSLFKSLLFFGAGAVLTSTGRRDIEKLGGLIHRMPHTAFLFLGGCLAISALPPLNGFVSEWLLFQAVLLSPDLPQWGLKLMVPAAGAMLALGAALSAACFVRAFGIAFLGRPRSPEAASARGDRCSVPCRHGGAAGRLSPWRACCRASSSMRSRPSCRTVVGSICRRRPSSPWLSIVPIAESRSSYNGLLVFVFIALSAIARASRSFIASPRDALRRGPGLGLRLSRSESGDAIYGRQLRAADPPRASAKCFLARERVDMPAPGDPRPARLEVRLRDLIWDVFYAPITGWIAFAADRIESSPVPDDPALPQSRLRGARRAAAGGGDMDVILELAVQGVQMLLVLVLAPLLLGFTRKVKARLLRRQGPPVHPALSRSPPADAARRSSSPRMRRGCSAARPT